FPGVPIIAGGVEASLRRLAHYDYWSDTVRRSILLDAKADLLVYGMGEQPIVEIARRLAAGQSVKDLRDMRGVAYALGASETPPAPHAVSRTLNPARRLDAKVSDPTEGFLDLSQATPEQRGGLPASFCLLPSYEEVKADKLAFVKATRIIHINTNPFNAKH